MNRVRAATLICLLCVPSMALAQLRAEVVASGLTDPLGLTADPAIAGVFYIVEQRGLVRVLQDGQLRATPFIDLRGVVLSGGERGLLGMAFDPNAASGRVFFNFTNSSGHTVVARFQRFANDPLVAEPSTRFDLLWSTGERLIRQPFANHNGGHLAFGPDGFLYISMGDGGSGNDPQNNAQNPATLLGKILRIDVNVGDSEPSGFRIPPDNPFLDGNPIAALPEIWSFGWRNPWRFSFDDFGVGATGAFIAGDVGQNAREEVDYEPRGASGRNYGWRIFEGRLPTPGVPPTTPAYGPLTDPIYDYTHDDGRAVTGGFVYRGTRLPAAYQGRYFFADFVSSRVWSMGLAVNPATGEATTIDVIEHTAELGGSAALGGVASFGRDLQGELYLATFAGRVLRIAPNVDVPNPPRELRAAVTGTNVLISWNAPRDGAVPAAYRLDGGSAPGLSDLGVAFAAATQTSLFFTNLPAGTYYVRLHSVGTSGVSAPSNEIIIVISGGACIGPPPAPFGFAALVNGRTVRLVWALSDTPNGPTEFVIEAGSVAGGTDIATVGIDGSLRSLTVGAPPGMFFLRLRSRNACGTSAASNEIVVTVF